MSARPADPSSPLLVERVSFAWPNGRSALRHCQLRIPRPGLWMLVGSNGSGKSTLLRLIAGLLVPQQGTIRRVGKPALVFQNPDHQLLLPSCGSDLQLGLPDDFSPAERKQALQSSLKDVGLEGIEQRPIHSLSGGQKQRLAIAGALASQASLLLLDEPTALLDPDSQRDILGLIRTLTSRPHNPLTALWITHRLEELECCDGASLMEQGHLGPWEPGSDLHERLNLLRGGRGER